MEERAATDSDAERQTQRDHRHQLQHQHAHEHPEQRQAQREAKARDDDEDEDDEARTESAETRAAHVRWMKLAVEHGRHAVPVDTAYCVGAVLVRDGRVLATGYSRELPGNTHAEECALLKLSDSLRQDASSSLDAESSNSSRTATGIDLYTTMEPCSLRLSGRTPCAERIVSWNAQAPAANRIRRVFIGVKEPDRFVANCQGVQQLRQAGVRVRFLPECAALCATLNP